MIDGCCAVSQFVSEESLDMSWVRAVCAMITIPNAGLYIRLASRLHVHFEFFV